MFDEAIIYRPRVFDYLYELAENRPDDVFLVLDADRRSFVEVARQTDNLARALLAAGVSRGDRVSVAGVATPDFMVALLAIGSIGAIYVGLNPKYTVGEMAYVTRDAEPLVIIDLEGHTDAAQAELVDAVVAQTPSVRTLVARNARAGALSLDDFIADGKGIDDAMLVAARRSVEAMDALALVYTSGSTGRPKGAILPHHGFCVGGVVQSRHFIRAAGVRRVVLCSYPINHVACIGDVCAAELIAGSTIVFQAKFDAEEVLDLIERERVTLWGGVPAMLIQTMALERFASADLSSVNAIGTGGNPAPISLIRAIRKMEIKIVIVYGSTETVSNITFMHEDASDEVLTSTIGWPDESYEVRVLRPDGSEADEGEEGEICIRSDHVMLGYWRRPEATAETIDEAGWLHTGDKGLRRPDGALKLVGRISEMYKSGGYNVYPREIELVLEDHPSVSLAAVVEVPDPIWTNVGHAYVISETTELPAKDLYAWCKERLANYKIPKEFFVCNELPMLSVGKIDKVALRK